MRKSLFKAVITSALLTTALTSTVNAASVEEIKKRAAEISELKELINAADPALRLAAIDTMQNSTDLAMKEMAFNAGFNSADESVVALTIRNRFSEVAGFTVLLSKPAEEGKALEIFNEYGGQVMVKIVSYDKDKGTFIDVSHYSPGKKSSTISGLNLMVSTNYCNGGFTLDDDLIYRGRITCREQQYTGEIRLF